MHLLDEIRIGGETKRKALKLCDDYGYDPEKNRMRYTQSVWVFHHTPFKGGYFGY